MAEERVERRLAAILCADIAGYSWLMGADEEGTLALLKSDRRELIDPLIAQHRGRIFKTTGDGMLIEFASVVDAPDAERQSFAEVTENHLEPGVVIEQAAGHQAKRVNRCLDRESPW